MDSKEASTPLPPNGQETTSKDAVPDVKGIVKEDRIEYGSERSKIFHSMLGCGTSGMVHLLPCGTRVKKTVTLWMAGGDGAESRLKRQAEHLRSEIAVMTATLTIDYLPNGTLDEHLRGFTVREQLDRKLKRGQTSAEKDAEMRRRHDSIPLRERARWCLEANDGVAALHNHGVIHCDLKPENMGLDSSWGVRIFDFAGSGIPSVGQEPQCLESTRYFMPRESWDVYSTTTDMFALGSSIYHIVTGVRPFNDVVDDDEVEALFAKGEFPDLSAAGAAAATASVSKGDDDTYGTNPKTGHVLFAETILRCWKGEFAAATDVLASLKQEVVQTFDEVDIKYIEEKSRIYLRSETVAAKE